MSKTHIFIITCIQLWAISTEHDVWKSNIINKVFLVASNQYIHICRIVVKLITILSYLACLLDNTSSSSRPSLKDKYKLEQLKNVCLHLFSNIFTYQKNQSYQTHHWSTQVLAFLVLLLCLVSPTSSCSLSTLTDICIKKNLMKKYVAEFIFWWTNFCMNKYFFMIKYWLVCWMLLPRVNHTPLLKSTLSFTKKMNVTSGQKI